MNMLDSAAIGAIEQQLAERVSMRTYVVRRLLLMVPTVFVVTFIVFVLMRLVPGDVVDIMVSQFAVEGGGDVEAARELLMEELGMDVSIIHQYGRWARRCRSSGR